MLEQEDAAFATMQPWECCSYVLRPKPRGPGKSLERAKVVDHARAYRENMSKAVWFRKANRCFLFGKAQCSPSGRPPFV
tara:strand:+ start:640 stop:876 length:237 start_codon:yes stop_codon:yes gene_type:complete|eukprot:scaffold50369_cov28-Phaeocystis_antarctica.AAC.2